MKKFKRYLLLLLVFVLLFAAFSVPASAASDDIKVSVWSYETSNPLNVQGDFRVFDIGYIYPSEMGENYVTERNPTHDYLSLVVAIGNSLSAHTFLEGKTYEVTFDGLVFYPLMEFDEYGNWSPQNVVKAVYTQWSDGTNTGSYAFYDAMVIRKTSESTFSLSITFTPTKDIARIYMALIDDIPDQGYQVGVYNPTLEVNELNVLEKIVRGITSSIERIINNNSSLSNIIKNISNAISSLQSAITSPLNSLKSEVSKIINSIIDIPSNIWNTIKRGILDWITPDWMPESFLSDSDSNLLFPSFAQTKAFYDFAKEMIDSKVALEIDIINLSNDFLNTIITNYNQSDYLHIDKITIPIGENKITFGPYDVRIIPEGLEMLSTWSRILTSVVFVMMFVSYLVQRIRRVMKA